MKRTTQFKNRFSLLILLAIAAGFFTNQGFGQGVVTNPASPWIVPPGVSQIKVEVWGGGGGGGGALGGNGGGGGGGAYNMNTWAVIAGQQYTITIGGGGTSGNGGNPSSVSGAGGSVSANGGSAGGTGFFGNGGSGAGGTGGIFVGGAGGASSGNGAGGGGGAGNGPLGDGSPGGNATTGTGGAGSFPGGAGGAFRTANGAGNNASTTTPGGGGGGGKGTNNGGVGGNGQVVITYTCPTATISYSTSSFCKSITSAPAIITGSSGGTFSTVPVSGLTISASGDINPSTSTAGTYTIHYKFAAVNGCSAVDATASVTINATPTTSSTSTNITCNGAHDGTITVTGSGGTGPYTFSVDGTTFLGPTGTTRLFTGLVPNNPYTIRVKDSNGCISK